MEQVKEGVANSINYIYILNKHKQTSQYSRLSRSRSQRLGLQNIVPFRYQKKPLKIEFKA